MTAEKNWKPERAKANQESHSRATGAENHSRAFPHRLVISTLCKSFVSLLPNWTGPLRFLQQKYQQHRNYDACGANRLHGNLPTSVIFGGGRNRTTDSLANVDADVKDALADEDVAPSNQVTN